MAPDSDMFGNPLFTITDYLTSDESYDPNHCVILLQHTLKKNVDLIVKSIEVFPFSANKSLLSNSFLSITVAPKS